MQIKTAKMTLKYTIRILLSQPLSFPVGKVEFLDLKPINFYEFLLANDEGMLIEYLQENNGKVPSTFYIFS